MIHPFGDRDISTLDFDRPHLSDLHHESRQLKRYHNGRGRGACHVNKGLQQMSKPPGVNSKDSTFRVARQSRIFQDVVDQIQEAILSGQFQTGDRLPSEREMREIFHVSRGTLREALRVLEQKGLIEVRLGVNGGAMVKAAMVETLTESLGLMLRLRKISLDHLHEFREDIEGIVTAKAAARAADTDVEKLRGLLDEAERCVAGGIAQWRAFLNVDKKFHQTLARITGNPIYIFIHDMVHDNIQPYYDTFLPPDERRLEENYQDLMDIFAAVKSRDAERAGDLARKHIWRFNEYMTGRQGDSSLKR
ncbi:GntR family transcriptional regulator [Desulfococcus multivorans]|uniref:GntR domain protein n=2 Tax=Desulfococcaceae TaxID=2931039 RepID=S7V8D0_DESML|nr:GntR family transcriptional regulator [Desulfococcus multivorans]EPR42914.1 GntR domain protein [Desulfococcus multivorans DSM 2059]SJZ89311.1 transcriptional regulator, GntR family [Desulfococcus multivorans DSM 2059]